MNLRSHLELMWRYKVVSGVGIVLSVVLAILAVYHVPSFERRGSETWSVESNILVTQAGFPEGRVTLPGQPGAPGAAPEETPKDDNGLSFADPNRLSSLALLYSVIADSDQVRTKLAAKPERGQIEAVALDATGNGTTFLPIINLTTKGSSAEIAQRLNVETFQAFKGLLESEQRANDIPPSGRIRLSLLNRPSEPLLVSGPSYTPALIALLLGLLATVAVVHILEGLAQRRPVAAPARDHDPDDDGGSAGDAEWIELAPVARQRASG